MSHNIHKPYKDQTLVIGGNYREPMSHNTNKPHCVRCGDYYSTDRWAIGYKFCLPCGDTHAREARKSWTVAPMSKSNYILVTDRELLKGLNKNANT